MGNVNDTVTVSWTAPSSAGSPITGYIVTPTPACVTCTTFSGTTATVSGLTVGGTYTFTVKAVNAPGTGPASAPSNTVVVPTKPGRAHRGGRHLIRQRSVGCVLECSQFTGGLPDHHVYRDVHTQQQDLHDHEQHHLYGEWPYQRHQLHLHRHRYQRHWHRTGFGSLCPCHSVDPPGTPTGVSATAGNGAANVSWTAPASNGGAPITGYLVTSTPGGIVAELCGFPMHRHRAHQRNQLPIHGGGHQRIRHRNRGRSDQLGDTLRTTRSADRCFGHLLCQRPVGGVVDSASLQRRIGDHRLHSHLERWSDLHDLRSPTCTVTGLTNGTPTPSR